MRISDWSSDVCSSDLDTVEVDPTTEVVIDIAFAQAVPSASLHTAIQSLVKPGGKAIRIFAEREGGGHRARLRPNEAYVSMQLAVLLANRRGALTAFEWRSEELRVGNECGRKCRIRVSPY